MSETGWVKIHRSIWDCDHLWDEEFSRGQAWIDMILMANHKSRQMSIKNQIINVERGSFITSRRKLEKRWKWGRKRVEGFLSFLVRAKMCVYEGTHTHTHISLINYDTYQQISATEVPTKVPTKEPRRSHEGTTNKNEKNEKNEKKMDHADCIGAPHPQDLNSESPSPETNSVSVPKKNIVPKFDPTGKKKFLDWVYLSEEQLSSVKTFYIERGCSLEDFQEAVRELDRWFGDNPKMRAKRTDDAKALKGWPLDRALQRRANLKRSEGRK